MVWRLIRSQHGVVSRAQLFDFGLTPAGIKHRVAIGRLFPVHRGVYAVGRRDLTREGRWMAAVLRCGPCSFLSHFSAAALWQIRVREPRGIEVSVPGDRRPKGITVHRRAIAAEEITFYRGIPVTDVVATLLDVAPELSRHELEAAIREADKRDLVDPDDLRAALDERPARSGTKILRATLDRRTFRLTDSQLERCYLPISDKAGLPRPLTQQILNGERVDFFYPDLNLVVETDGLRYHRTPQQQARDLLRDQKHLASGLTPLRFTHEQVKYEPAYVEEVLRSVAR